MGGSFTQHRLGRRNTRFAAIALLATLPLVGIGCNDHDSWFDPSVVGRWEHTPTRVPILSKLDIIEQDDGDFVESTQVTNDDLIPHIETYRFGPGDQLYIEVFDLLVEDQPFGRQVTVDALGGVDLPQLGRIIALERTIDQIKEAIKIRLKERKLIRKDPLITVELMLAQSAAFTVIGNVGGVGQYRIPKPNYRLLDAISTAGGIPPTTEKIFLIRQTPLHDHVRRGVGTDLDPILSTPEPIDSSDNNETLDLDALLEDITGSGSDSQGTPENGADSNPGMLLAQSNTAANPPAIDLVDSNDTPSRNTQGKTPPNSPDQPRDGAWVFVNNKWVRVASQHHAATNEETTESLITQRVIEIPVTPLLQGDARYNIVVRPGDVLRVPSPETGVVYYGGPGAGRAGTYFLPANGKLTLLRLASSAGGLSSIAIPERVDITRMVGEDHQATVRLNLRAIAEGTQPDVYLKADDFVNIGTNFWAQPLAVARNGFRMTYGFGFLLDRNFGADVFGPVPQSNR